MRAKNFFSTQFVNQQQQDGGRQELIVASNAWLFAAISVPLTVVTLAIWWVWMKFQTRQAALVPGQPVLASLKDVLSRKAIVPLHQPLEA